MIRGKRPSQVDVSRVRAASDGLDSRLGLHLSLARQAPTDFADLRIGDNEATSPLTDSAFAGAVVTATIAPGKHANPRCQAGQDPLRRAGRSSAAGRGLAAVPEGQPVGPLLRRRDRRAPQREPSRGHAGRRGCVRAVRPAAADSLPRAPLAGLAAASLDQLHPIALQKVYE